ncbi:SH3 domain [Trinorchestia longiramus]|nr:SH3 domain [Trinorchestia longiramus]
MFGNRPPEGYCHGSEVASHLQTALDEDGSDDDVFYPNTNHSCTDGDKVTRGGTPPCLSKPFSAVTPSMWPQDLTFFTSMENHKDPNHQPEYRFDEFGYRVEEEDGPEQSSRKLLSQPLMEDPIHKLRWAAELNLSSCDGEGEVSWEGVPSSLPRTDKLCSLVRQGVPHSFRPQVWMRLAGSLDKKRSAKVRYEELVSASSSDILSTNRQIEKDLLRTLPSNACFSHVNATGIPRLRRLLRAMAWFYPDIGYCQGMGMIAANLLLFLEEEDAFWLMCTIVEDLLPASYYSSTLMGVQADQRVLQSLVSSFLPSLASVIAEHDIEVSLITLHWFVTVFASVLHVKLLIRTWDLFFCEGSVVLFKLTLAMLKIKEAEVRALDNSADIFNALSDIPRDLDDADCLIKMMESVSSGVSEVMVETQRRQQLTSIMHEHGTLINLHHPPQHLPKQHLNREAVLQVARHFQSMEPSLCQVSLVPDYSLASHGRDLQHFMTTAAARRRRAKALLDFERHDQDELGFRKNDIITIISERDEHCWVGELNGLRGAVP